MTTVKETIDSKRCDEHQTAHLSELHLQSGPLPSRPWGNHASLFRGEGLKAKAIRGSAWTLGGYGIQQIIRLASNLLLTRLLFPEAFGLMALINVFMQGLAMFSDVGIGPSIIQSDKGDQPGYLNTAWTIQVARGFVLWCCACALAYPVSLLYREPQLLLMLPVAALSAVLAGFSSTKLFTANRNLAFGRLTLLEIFSQATNVVVLVALAWQIGSVWALVIGGIFGSAIKVILSHLMLPGPGNRFCWEKKSVDALAKFGRWILFTTMLTFITRQGDKLIIGYFLSPAELGVYAIAVFIIEAGTQGITAIAQRVAFPSLSRIAREQPLRLGEVYYRVRRPIEWTTLSLAGFLMIQGPFTIGLLYDDRYKDAGWMVQVFAMRLAVGPISGIGLQALIALGHPRHTTYVQALRAVLLLLSVPIAFMLYGVNGAVWVVGLNFCITYPIICVILRRYSVTEWKHEWRVLYPAIAGVIVGLALSVFQGP